MTINQRSQATVHDAGSLLTSLPDVVLVLDAMGRIDFASVGSAGYLGLHPPDWIGLSVLDHIHQEDIAAVVERLQLSQRGQPAPTQALPLRVAVGDDQWCRVAAHGFVQIDTDGLTGTLVTLRDTSGSASLETARQSALAGVFNRENPQIDVARDDRQWVANNLLPQVLNHPDPRGPLVLVVVMTLADPRENQDSESPHLDDPVAALAHRVQEILRPQDVVSRLGDSQLVILCNGLADAVAGLLLAQRLHRWCSPSPLGAACPRSLPLTTGCAFASQGDDANDVLDYASSSDGQIESGRFLLAAA